MLLPWGTGQGMSLGALAGDPFWPLKGHSKRVSGGHLEIQGTPKTLVPHWNKFWIR